jgi:hypothetical protein
MYIIAVPQADINSGLIKRTRIVAYWSQSSNTRHQLGTGLPYSRRRYSFGTSKLHVYIEGLRLDLYSYQGSVNNNYQNLEKDANIS